MCGSHGSYRILSHLVDEPRRGHSRAMEPDQLPRDPQAEIEQEVKLMYARGEIDSGTYYRLRELAESGQLNWSDLRGIERKGGSGPVQENRTPGRRDAEIVSSLNQLYTHRKQLEDARRNTDEVLQTLEKEAVRLEEQAKEAQVKARQVMDNEQAARDYLAARQKALERLGAVQGRIEGLQENLRRIESLEADLSTREAELKALESGEQLAELEASIRQELYANE